MRFISARKMEVLLAALLSRSGQVVTTGQLFTELWGENPPRRASASLHVYISQLRAFLSRPGQSQSSIVTRSPGYLIQVGADDVDALDFESKVEEGRTHAALCRYEDAVASLEAALALWRGPALHDLRDGPLVNTYVTWLEETRVECHEMLIESYLRLGRHREVVGRLQMLIVEYPLREVFYRYLMIALHRAERRAEALHVYQLVRRALNEELGLEPCRSLRELQQAILNGEDASDMLLDGPSSPLLGAR
ncbi:BTAD domain-containing putative transcriptional regulator [Streptomyces sp. NPDC057307]|uniref:AfsR/SARP family transcriptional regulator n=1 Tax=Streptomyces sp. NPDC057307 TaxID=3346096 RepID=UPI003626AC45